MQLEEKVQNAMRENFVGNYCFTADEIDTICEKVGNKLREIDPIWGETLPESYYPWTFVALVNIAKTWQSEEDTFWGHIYKKLVGQESSQKIYNCITGAIDQLGKRYGLFVLNGPKKKYYATILLHAFSPKKSTQAFFDLCWEIFCEDLNLFYTPADPVYSQIANQLQKRLTNLEKDDDKLELGSHPYEFRAGIKGLAVEYPNIMRSYIEDTICKINRLFQGTAFRPNDYFQELLVEWWREKEQAFGTEKERKSTEKAVSDYTLLQPKYILNDDTLFLHIPPIRLLSQLEIRPELTVSLDGEEMDSMDLCTRGTGLSMTTLSEDIDLSRILTSNRPITLSVQIRQGNQCLYQSEKRLYRSYLLFKGNREVTASECSTGNYMLYVTDFSELCQYPQEISRQTRKLFTLFAHEGDILQSKSKTVFFSDELQKRELQFLMERNTQAVFLQLDEEYCVADGEIWVAAKDGANISDFGVRYTDTTFPLSDFSEIHRNQMICFPISELLTAGEPQKIAVFRYSDNKIVAAINVVKFDHIQIEYDQDIYYDYNQMGKVQFITERFHKTADFDMSQEEVLLPFDDGELKLFPPYLKWRMDQGSFHNQPENKGIWYRDIGNTAELEISVPPTMQCEVFLTNNHTVPFSDQRKNRFKLGESIYAASFNGMKEISAFVKLNQEKNFYLGQFFLKEQFLSEPLQMLSFHTAGWYPESYIGDKSVTFAVNIKQGGRTVKALTKGFKREMVDLTMLSEGLYTVQIYAVPVKGFKIKKLLYEGEIYVGNIKEMRYRNTIFCVDRVMLAEESRAKTIVPFYIDNIRFLDDQEGSDYYSGQAYIVTGDGRKRYLEYMLNDDKEREQINPVRIEIRDHHTCWIVFGLNPNDLMEFSAEFTLDMDQKISNRDFHTKAIDYFYFTERGK